MPHIKKMIEAAASHDPIAFKDHFEKAMADRVAGALATKRKMVAGAFMTNAIKQEEYEAEQDLKENVIPEVMDMIKQSFGSAKFNKLAAPENKGELMKVVHMYADLHAVEGAEKIAGMCIKHFAPTDSKIDKK